MAKGPIERITQMLRDDAPERRLAAVIVLGELKPRAATVSQGLLAVLEDDAPALQRHALEALRRIGLGKRGLDRVWPLLASRDAEVREAAAAAIASAGESVVPEVRTRLAAAEGVERRALESVLSQLGGREAFDALLDALAEGDEASNRRAALELRAHVKQADAATRRGYRARLTKFLGRRDLDPSAQAAAVKVLGFLEDPKSEGTLLAIAKDEKAAPAVRQEAWIALRFALAGGASKGALEALLAAASDDDRALAQTALMTLAGLTLPAALAPELSALTHHPDLERARIAIDKLASMRGAAATRTLVGIVAEADKRRAELAAEAIADRSDAVAPLAEALAATGEPERAKLLGRVLGDAKLPAPLRTKLLQAGVAKLVAGREAWEPALGAVKDRDEASVSRRLAAEAARLRKARKADAEARVLRALLRLGLGDDAHRYRVASLDLADSPLDPRRRGADPALRALTELAGRGYDVAGALRKDRAVGLEALYYVGFCFLEDDVAGGEELLEEVVAKGGRKKIAKAAKNKLKLGG